MKARYIRSGLTLLVLIGVVGGAGYWGWQHTTEAMPGLRPATTCTTKSVQSKLTPNDVIVSVYNAGNRAGLAGETMTKLAKRGFRQGQLGNTQENVRTVLVRTSDPNSVAARLVAKQFGSKVEPVVSEVDLGPGVDVVLGNKFKGLVAKAPKQITYTQQQQICSSS